MTEFKLIYANDGKPFDTAGKAQSFIARGRLAGSKVIEAEGGFVIKSPIAIEDKEEIKQEESVKTAEEQPTPPAQPQEVVGAKNGPDIKIIKTFRPRNATEIPEKYKDPAFDYKFVYNDKRNVEKKLRSELGWRIDHFVAPKMREDGLLFADGSCDSTYVLGDTILMRVPKPNAQAYRNYVAERTMDGVKKRQKEYEDKVRAVGSKTEGNIEVTHRHLS